MSSSENNFLNEKITYTIPDVPYYGVHNYFGNSTGPIINNAAAILNYWNPGSANEQELKNNFSGSVNISQVEAFFSQKGFAAEEINLSVPELKKYINPETKTPLLLFLPVSADQPVVKNAFAAALLIGIDEKKQKLTFQNYWLGNNYDITYADFDKMESKFSAYQRDRYIVVQPKNLTEKLQEISQRKIETYPDRTVVMQNGEQIFKDYAVGRITYNSKMYDTAFEYFSKVENSSKFNDFFPPYFKADLFYLIGQICYNNNDFDKAMVYAQKAATIDNNLNQPFKDWSAHGVPVQISSPYVLLGDIYRKKNDFQNAKDNYLKALSIAPDDAVAKNGLAVLQAIVK